MKIISLIIFGKKLFNGVAECYKSTSYNFKPEVEVSHRKGSVLYTMLQNSWI